MNDSSRILVTYTTNAGSTAEVAERIAEGLKSKHGSVEVRPIEDAGDLSAYSGIVVGGPMIMGWHRRAGKYLKKHRETFRKVPFSVFMTAMEVTETERDQTVYVDPGVLKPPAVAGSLTFKEKHTTVSHYTAPLYKNGHPRPKSVGIFGGKLDFTKLKFPQVLFVMLVVGASPGDKRNWEAIENWAEKLEF